VSPFHLVFYSSPFDVPSCSARLASAMSTNEPTTCTEQPALHPAGTIKLNGNLDLESYVGTYNDAGYGNVTICPFVDASATHVNPFPSIGRKR
jgi:hypothetical protein